MDPRTAAHALEQIGELLELRGENRFKARAFRTAARVIRGVQGDDLGPLLRSGELRALRGVGDATVGVLRDMIETGESTYLVHLRENLPDGVLEMLRLPGLGSDKIHRIHEELGVNSMDDLEEAARGGRLSTLPGFGPKTAEKILAGIARLREAGSFTLYHRAREEAERLRAMVGEHPDVVRAEIAGSLRRRREVIRDVDIVAECAASPAAVVAAFARAPGVTGATRVAEGEGEGEGEGGSASIRFVDGTLLDLYCVRSDDFAVALWRATGSEAHERAIREHAAARGLTFDGDTLRDAEGSLVPVSAESAMYSTLGLAHIAPELRENRGEIEAAQAGMLPELLTPADILGVLHCHTRYSDGAGTIAEMADAARERGWRYIGISDHSRAAFYAGGLSVDAVLAQHEEIDRLNAERTGFRILKGIEADILADGQLDYGPELLQRFDYVIGSVHSRFAMDERAMTDRVLTALDSPYLTILGHPTGRLLLSREPYAIDIEAVLEKAARVRVAIELNADPRRLDLDWRLCHRAKTLGVCIAIGPDAHSTGALDNMEVGVGIARKGWLTAANVLNTRSANAVLAYARERRRGPRGSRLGGGPRA